MKVVRKVTYATLAVCLLAAAAHAQEAKVTPVLKGLLNPTGIAVQPGTGHLFVADSGALRVLRFDPAAQKAESVVKGFPKDVYGKGPMYDIGPLGVAFLGPDTLVVGDGSLPDGQELVRFYGVPAPGKSIAAADMKFSAGPIGPGDDSLKGEGNFYALAVSAAAKLSEGGIPLKQLNIERPSAIFVTCNGDDTKGWVSKIDWVDGKPGKLTPFIKTKVATNVDAPVAITENAEGQVVVGQMGEITVPNDSLLTIYDAKTGEKRANGETKLFDIAGLAYSPKSGKLYAVDYAWMDTTKGGLFRLDVTTSGDKLNVEAVKIASLDKPTALAFAPDGTLYVTQIGTAKEGVDRPGSIVKIEGDL